MDEITAAGGVRSLPSREAIGAFVQRTQALDAWMVAQVTYTFFSRFAHAFLIGFFYLHRRWMRLWQLRTGNRV